MDKFDFLRKEDLQQVNKIFPGRGGFSFRRLRGDPDYGIDFLLTIRLVCPRGLV